MRSSVASRFWSKVNFCGPRATGHGSCWLWTAAIGNGGYGYFWWRDGVNVRAHRVAYVIARGLIPNGLDLDHLCRNRQCVRPSHLDPVTRAVNIIRGNGVQVQNAKKTHCPKGHPYSGENLRLRVRGSSVTRCCRLCSGKVPASSPQAAPQEKAREPGDEQ